MYGSLHGLTDTFFKNTINKISANDTVFFTSKQLFYDLNKNLSVPPLFPRLLDYIPAIYQDRDVGSLWFLSATGFIILLVSTYPLIGIYAVPLGATIFLVLILAGMRRQRINNQLAAKRHRIEEEQRRLQIEQLNTRTQHLKEQFHKGQLHRTFVFEEQEFQVWLERWQSVNGTIAKLLLPMRPETVSSSPPADVTAYSFDRLVVCQSDIIAQLLIANHFHFENNCAVLSVNGYPPRIFSIVMKMIRRNTNLKVFAFHDCSPSGMCLIHQLRTSDRWFQGKDVVIIDAGLRPQQVIEVARSCRSERDFRVFIEQSSESAQTAQNLLAIGDLSSQHLLADELEWLTQGYFVMLESFTPQKLIQVLNRSIALSRQDKQLENDGLILLEQEGRYIYATENFG